eukprot:12401806-Alexandrium_andersonii.AAC.1
MHRVEGAIEAGSPLMPLLSADRDFDAACGQIHAPERCSCCCPRAPIPHTGTWSVRVPTH